MALGVVVTVLACFVGALGTIIEIANKLVNSFAGPMLGIFILGMMTRRTEWRGAFWGLLVGTVVTGLLHPGQQRFLSLVRPHRGVGHGAGRAGRQRIAGRTGDGPLRPGLPVPARLVAKGNLRVGRGMRKKVRRQSRAAVSCPVRNTAYEQRPPTQSIHGPGHPFLESRGPSSIPPFRMAPYHISHRSRESSW